jgi:hypothetical protein
MLTQTTEADLRSHCQSFFANFEAKQHKYMSRISNAVGMFLDGNPYEDRDWKKHTPTRHYKDLLTWFGDDEEEMQEYIAFQMFLSDVNIFAKHFQWEELDDVKFELETFMNYMSSGQEDLRKLEEHRFAQAKKKFEEDNKQWIEEQRLLKVHKSSHHSGHLLRVKAEDGENIDEHLACVHCKLDYEYEVERTKSVREYEARQRELKPEFYETKVKQETVSVPCVASVEQTCEDCGYKTKFPASFEMHKNQPDHKRALQLKSWHCEDCHIQCQSQIKYDDHVQSKKHQKNVDVNWIANNEYKCEKCNYETKFKHHYDQHCTTKKHMETVE